MCGSCDLELVPARHRKPGGLLERLGEQARAELKRQDEAVERFLERVDQVPVNEDGTVTFPVLQVGPPKVAPRSILLWVGVDLDGTIAEPVWTPENPTSEIGAPIERNIAKLREVVAAGYKVVIHTARAWTDYEAIESWLNFHGIPWHQIQCGKPLFALYVDDRGRHSEEESWLPTENPTTER